MTKEQRAELERLAADDGFSRVTLHPLELRNLLSALSDAEARAARDREALDRVRRLAEEIDVDQDGYCCWVNDRAPGRHHDYCPLTIAKRLRALLDAETATAPLVTCELWRHGAQENLVHVESPECATPMPAPKETALASTEDRNG